MLTQNNFTKKNIERLREISGNDPSLLEKTVYAFGLLEAITKTGMPFVFKGGTCLMLLLDKPRRLSTDIDIIVKPGTNVDEYIKKAGQIFPFKSQQEDIRKGMHNIEKRHYEFIYDSPINEKPLVIILDVLFENHQYQTLLAKPIANDLLLNEGEDFYVDIPDVDSILGDKLTAFAPHTTGIPFGSGKELEIVKQLYDCYTLIKEYTDYTEVYAVYKSLVKIETNYRGLSLNVETVLMDTISACFCIISRGRINSAEYMYYADGIRRIGGHIYGEMFNGEVASQIACEVLYLASCMYSETEPKRIAVPDDYIDEKLVFKGSKSVSYLRKINLECYAYIVESVRLLGDELEDIIYFYE